MKHDVPRIAATMVGGGPTPIVDVEGHIRAMAVSVVSHALARAQEMLLQFVSDDNVLVEELGHGGFGACGM